MPIYKLERVWTEQVCRQEIMYVVAESTADANVFINNSFDETMNYWKNHDSVTECVDSDNHENLVEQVTENKLENDGIKLRTLINVTELLKELEKEKR